MATYSLTQTAKTNLSTVITNLTNKLTTINTDASSPAANADFDSVFAGILGGYQAQVQKILDDLTKLEKNLSAG